MFVVVAYMDFIQMVSLYGFFVELGSSSYGCQACFSPWIPPRRTYMQQPLRLVHHGPITLVCKFKKSLYGLEQASCVWDGNIHNLFRSCGFTSHEVEHDLYIFHQDGKILIIVLYMDDLLLTSHCTSMINALKQQLEDSFEMIDLGMLCSFLGLQISLS